MLYNDVIYGTVTIKEPVLLALLETDAMQRLKGVLQHGISGLIGVTTPSTRFEHSLGAMILVRQLGASLEEQIAALLHDVSHTAFSHVIDYVFDDRENQGYHDTKKEEFISGTEIPATLAKFGYDWHDFIDEENFPLLEQPSPRLCADRLDYFLRDAVPLGLATEADIAFAIKSLVVVNERIAVNDFLTAQWMAYRFIAADNASWSNFDEVGLYELTAQAIKTGFRVGAITQADLWGTDIPMWEKLHSHPDSGLSEQLALIKPETRFVWDEENPDFWVNTKLRSIDPDVVVEGQMQPLSTLDEDFAQHRRDYLSRKGGKWPMRVLR